MIKKSKEHLKEVNQGYFYHLLFCLKTSFELIKLSIIAIIHGVCPATYDKKVSRDIEQMYKNFESKNRYQ